MRVSSTPPESEQVSVPRSGLLFALGNRAKAAKRRVKRMGQRLWRRRGRAEVVLTALLIGLATIILALLAMLPPDLLGVIRGGAN